jgi:hypothetical protein
MIGGVGEIRYDQLVIATGSVSSWFGHDDWAASSIGLKSLRDAETVRLRLLGAFEWAETRADDEDDVRRLLTFVIVGGGATGVELAGSIRILARDTLRRDFRRIDTNTARVLLIEGRSSHSRRLPRASRPLRSTSVGVDGRGRSDGRSCVRGRRGWRGRRRRADPLRECVLVRGRRGDPGGNVDRGAEQQERGDQGRARFFGAGAS